MTLLLDKGLSSSGRRWTFEFQW